MRYSQKKISNVWIFPMMVSSYVNIFSTTFEHQFLHFYCEIFIICTQIFLSLKDREYYLVPFGVIRLFAKWVNSVKTISDWFFCQIWDNFIIVRSTLWLPDPRGAGLHEAFQFSSVRPYVRTYVCLQFVQFTPTRPIYLGSPIFLQIPDPL